jgi:hypothetical protein
MRVAVNQNTRKLNELISAEFRWETHDEIKWVSPLQDDQYSEYYDEEFLQALEISELKMPLREFWPAGGPRWDALARTRAGKCVLVEAKAYIEEAVDFGSKASPHSLTKIRSSLANAKEAYGVSADAPWESPFYQYPNRLAHLYYLRKMNNIDAYLLFLYFSNAPDVPDPCTKEQWQGAARLVERCLGLRRDHPFRPFVGTLIWDVNDLMGKL